MHATFICLKLYLIITIFDVIVSWKKIATMRAALWPTLYYFGRMYTFEKNIKTKIDRKLRRRSTNKQTNKRTNNDNKRESGESPSHSETRVVCHVRTYVGTANVYTKKNGKDSTFFPHRRGTYEHFIRLKAKEKKLVKLYFLLAVHMQWASFQMCLAVVCVPSSGCNSAKSRVWRQVLGEA